MKHCPTCGRRLLVLSECVACADKARDEQLARNSVTKGHVVQTGTKLCDLRKVSNRKDWGLGA